jgi:hypothetical protein
MKGNINLSILNMSAFPQTDVTGKEEKKGWMSCCCYPTQCNWILHKNVLTLTVKCTYTCKTVMEEIILELLNKSQQTTWFYVSK